MTRWVTVSEAARLEGLDGRSVNKSSISRFIDRNADVPVRRDTRGRVQEVDYDALAEARRGSLAVADSRPAGLPFAHPPQAAAAPASRKRALEEEKLELDLAERKAEVLSRAATVMAVETAGLAFVQSLERRRRGLANKLEGRTAREIELELKAADRALLEGLAKDLAGAAAGVTIEPMAEDVEPIADVAEAD
ncbi:MAG TPA: hypothetical protein VFF48_03455 [Brevundimonas sp.]|nr:hypothetical protein [Brevundimonas sp.]